MSSKSKKVEALESGIVLLSRNAVVERQDVRHLDNHLSFSLNSGIVLSAMYDLWLYRLKNRNQLQLLTNIEIGVGAEVFAQPHTFFHNRLEHSLRAAAMHVRMRPVGMSDRDLAIGALAALLHDMWLAPGGDSWKSISQQRISARQLSIFDEDDSFALKMMRFNGKEWKKLCHKYGLSPNSVLEEVQAIVWGKGLRGEIQEIADTASYMLCDLAALQEVRSSSGSSTFVDVLDFASSNAWDVWHYTYQVGNSVVVLKPEVLKNFLWLRAMLWGRIYNAPATKFLELLMRKVVYPYLVEERKIDLKALLKEDDAWLWNIVEDTMCWPRDAVNNLGLLGGWPRVAEFSSREDVLKHEKELRKKGCFTLAAWTDDFQKASSKTGKYNVLDSAGKASPYNLVFPLEARSIEEFFENRVNPRFPQLYWVENPVFSAVFEEAWVRAIRRWESDK